MKKNQLYYILATVLAVVLSYAIYSWAFSGSMKDDVQPQAKVTKKPAVKSVPQKKPVEKKPDNDSISPLFVMGEVKDSTGAPMKGIVISDSYTCVKTDAKGRYSFLRNAQARFIWFTVPANCEVPVHQESNTANFYLPVAKDQKEYDFTLNLLPDGVETSYRMIVIGDPQITNAYSPYFQDATDNKVQKHDIDRFNEETMVDIRKTISELPEGTAVYGLSMGDNVQYYGGYNPDLEREMRMALGSTRMKVFSVIGNHDQDGKQLYRDKWMEQWGPTDFSFDRGDVHYVCFNNVHYRHGGYWSPGELTNDQLRWLKRDLSMVDRSMKVILNYHVPITFGTHPNAEAKPLDLPLEQGHYTSSKLTAIMQLLNQFSGGYELFCGHTHFSCNHEITYRGQNIMERCHAAACGNIWQSNINICGTPNGYYVYTMDGTRISRCYYKGTRWDASQQMSVFMADTDFNGESYAADWNIARDKKAIVANVFNADSRWKVVAIENGIEHPMTRIASKGQDAFATGYHHKYCESVSYNFISKANGYLLMNHLYYYVPEVPTAEIQVKATDPYGYTYTINSADAVTEPFFNYGHYYMNGSATSHHKKRNWKPYI